MESDTFSIVPRGSFSWSAAVDVLARLPPLAHVATVTSSEVKLSLLADGDFAPVTVRLRFEQDALHGSVSDRARLDVARRQVARILSLDHDGTGWERLPIARLVPGLRPVCFSSPYETACWAIVSQRISKAQARRVFATLAEEHGGFPPPDRMLRIGHVRGLAAVKTDRLHGVAAAARDGALDAERLRALGDDAGPESLRRIKGIGPFWSSGIYLRACGIRDVFPAEPIAIAALARMYRLGLSPTHDAIAGITDSFRPYRMWACFLLRVADARGLIDDVSSLGELRDQGKWRRTPLVSGMFET